MNNQAVAERFVQGRPGKSHISKETLTHVMSSDGLAIYSYGDHFPMAVWLDEQRTRVAINDDTWGNATYKHQMHVRTAIPFNIHKVFVSNQAIKKILAIRQAKPDNDVVVVLVDKYLSGVDPMNRKR